MPIENIHSLRHEIHSTLESGEFASKNFDLRIAALAAHIPTGDSQNAHMYEHAIQEFNRKLYDFERSQDIIQPIDAGFRPLNFDDFFGGVPTPLVPDFLELENDSFLLQQNSFKLILEQDV